MSNILRWWKRHQPSMPDTERTRGWQTAAEHIIAGLQAELATARAQIHELEAELTAARRPQAVRPATPIPTGDWRGRITVYAAAGMASTSPSRVMPLWERPVAA